MKRLVVAAWTIAIAGAVALAVLSAVALAGLVAVGWPRPAAIVAAGAPLAGVAVAAVRLALRGERKEEATRR